MDTFTLKHLKQNENTATMGVDTRWYSVSGEIAESQQLLSQWILLKLSQSN